MAAEVVVKIILTHCIYSEKSLARVLRLHPRIFASTARQRRRLAERGKVRRMGIFGAMITAVAGLRAQSYALENISGNIANSQTTGFKRVDTSFISLLTTSSLTTNEPGAVVARPDYVNSVQGTITQTEYDSLKAKALSKSQSQRTWAPPCWWGPRSCLR